MKALIISEPGEAKISDVPVPTLNAGEALIKVNHVGFCGSDLNTYRGLNPMVVYPRVPGHEISGEIVETGVSVPERWRPSMAVTVSPYTACGECDACLRQRPNCCRNNQTMGVQRDGAVAEFIAVPHEKLFHSSTLSSLQLALVEPLTVGGHAADRAETGPDDAVAVIGCGAVGLGAVAAAAQTGADVIAVDIDERKLDVARQAGATAVVNAANDDLGGGLLDANHGAPPDVIIEAVGSPATFKAAIDEVAFAGRVVYIGYAKEPVSYETKLFVQKELTILGSRNALPGNFKKVIRMLENGGFPCDEVITRVVPIDQAGEALKSWAENPAAVTRILVQIAC